MYRGEEFLEDLRLDRVQHLLHLAEDESAVLGDGFGEVAVGVCGAVLALDVGGTDTAVDEQILQSAQFRSVRNILKRCIVFLQIRLSGLELLVARLNDHRRSIT